MQIVLGHFLALMTDSRSDKFSVYPVRYKPCVEEMPEGVERETFFLPVNSVSFKDLMKTHADELKVYGFFTIETENQFIRFLEVGKACL